MKKQRRVSKKLRSAAAILPDFLRERIGGLVPDEDDILKWATTETKREQVYRAMHLYGYRWKPAKGRWMLILPTWIDKLCGRSWLMLLTGKEDDET